MPKSRIIFNRIIQLIYPLFAYFLIYNSLYMLTNNIWGGFMPPLFWLGVSAAITIVVIFFIYVRLPIVRNTKFYNRDTFKWEILGIVAVVFVGILLNVLFTKLGILQISESYTKANEVLYSGNIICKIIVNCMLIPVLEELVYRGCICGQLKMWLGMWPAVIISALIFGMMHMNLVQFLYASVMGIALGYVYSKTDKLHLTILAHGLTNLVVVLTTIVGG
ncbi:MAG: CPBP family intramembrane metalloprotease [Lachnospiraceae bacterium]|nr:CPBP family intramembrane metalloprotease [Lachnospiraceae bacterium]